MQLPFFKNDDIFWCQTEFFLNNVEIGIFFDVLYLLEPWMSLLVNRFIIVLIWQLTRVQNKARIKKTLKWFMMLNWVL